jgi:hypothetical protein
LEKPFFASKRALRSFLATYFCWEFWRWLAPVRDEPRMPDRFVPAWRGGLGHDTFHYFRGLMPRKPVAMWRAFCGLLDQAIDEREPLAVISLADRRADLPDHLSQSLLRKMNLACLGTARPGG